MAFWTANRLIEVVGLKRPEGLVFFLYSYPKRKDGEKRKDNNPKSKNGVKKKKGNSMAEEGSDVDVIDLIDTIRFVTKAPVHVVTLNPSIEVEHVMKRLEEEGVMKGSFFFACHKGQRFEKLRDKVALVKGRLREKLQSLLKQNTFCC